MLYVLDAGLRRQDENCVAPAQAGTQASIRRHYCMMFEREGSNRSTALGCDSDSGKQQAAQLHGGHRLGEVIALIFITALFGQK